ncbi:MAG: 50S ribosomal protein L24e [Candidatus Aenigmarchaeota archaeon]|nr:50S ribosomal protein L24e [Candidatus Aenigmarchaeota archaeon]MCK5322078.1 50S ribosomal protein L24e [Candidatus Aenigmarchaeota archaeon]
MPKCIFCGKIFDESVGLLLVQKNGDQHFLCSRKCEKNMAVRKPRNVRWTETYRKDKEQRLRVASSPKSK